MMYHLKEGADEVQKQDTNDAPRHDEGTSIQLIEQQAESARYLNELNTIRT